MRTPSVILGALAAITSLSGVALAQGASPRTTPNKPPASTGALNEDAMTDVDPAVAAQCKDTAAKKMLKGAERDQFIRSCFQPED
jgi:hypothetical protein